MEISSKISQLQFNTGENSIFARRLGDLLKAASLCKVMFRKKNGSNGKPPPKSWLSSFYSLFNSYFTDKMNILKLLIVSIVIFIIL